MSSIIKLKRGFDINLVGKAEAKVEEVNQPETFVVKPSDFVGVKRPKLIIKEGDNVKAGSPLFFERGNEEVKVTSPVSGEIVEIKRGAKRVVLEIKILADKEVEFEPFDKYSVADIAGLGKEEVVSQLTRSGAWVNLIQRPFGSIANPADEPKAIFISSFDSHPLAPDYKFLLEGQEQYLQTGVEIIKKLTSGVVHVGVDNDAESSVFTQLEKVQINRFSGPHPAGNVGTHIHHVAPISKGEIVWTINPVGLAQIGKLFTEGKYDTAKKVAITGSQIEQPVYVTTFPGADLNKLVGHKIKKGENRIISGNVLTGEGLDADNAFLGYYDHQVTVISEGKYEEFLGWILPSTKKLSFHRAIGLFSGLGKSEYVVDTNTHGEHRNFVISGSFEKVMPLDILPTYLFKAILAEDFDEMEALGIYEVIEEDVALCEFVDVSKNPLQEILREGIDLIQEG